MPDDVVLSVRNVSKKFCRNLRRSMAYGIKDLACNLAGVRQDSGRLRQDEFWALDDVSLELRRSEFLGIIGANGSGKSTLLRLIHGIFPPDKGEIVTRGRVGALIALGAGFHPHMTGLENIYLNGAILGMNRKFINSRLSRIVDFAEIGEFLEAPVSTYSSGMRVRLGFSIAAHMSPDLLLVDEVLSVGDSSFRERCYNHMIEYKDSGGTVIFISHNTLAVEQVCERVIWLERGQIRLEGDAERVIEAYEQWMLELSRQAEGRLGKGEKACVEGPVRLCKVETCDECGNPTPAIAFGEPFEVRIHYEIDGEIESPYFGIGIRKGFNTAHPFASSMSMAWDNVVLGVVPPQGVVSCRIHDPNLSPGSYSVQCFVNKNLTSQVGEKFLVRPFTCASFIVEPGLVRNELSSIPAMHLVSGMPPAVLKHEWLLDGKGCHE